MKFEKSDIEGLVIIQPSVFEDSRGLFFESYNRENFRKNGIDVEYLQDNQSHSKAKVIRGLHYQLAPHAQGKLVRVLEGSILDVAVDIRKSSRTYGKYFSIELSADNKKQLWIPAGFAHGFSVLSDTATVLYKCDNLYNKSAEGGIRFDDPELNIDWRINTKEAIVSEKDINLPWFRECNNNFQ